MLINTRVDCGKTRNKCEEFLKFYIRMMPNQSSQCVSFLSGLLKCELAESSDCDNCVRYKHLNLSEFNDDEEEHQSATLITFELNKSDDIIQIEQVEVRCRTLVKLLNKLDNNELKIELMLYLFEQIQNSLLTSECIKTTSNQMSQNDQTLLNIEKESASIATNINLRIIYFTQLSCLFESIDPQFIIEKHLKIIQFCQFILNKVIMYLEFNIENDEYELVHLVFSILSVFTTGLIDLDHELKQLLQVFTPILIKFKQISMNKDLNEMADALHANIATYGAAAVKIESQSADSKPLIEEICSQNDEYSNCFKDLNDALIPVRAHGLVTLRKLIEKRDERVMDDVNKTVNICLKNLKHEDSYVYLAAVQVLIALADCKPDLIMDVLIGEFKSGNVSLDLETRLKIGEVLTKSIRNFNELVPKYGPKLIDCFLVGCKNPEEFIRSSSLSNLGETCKLLKYSLGHSIFEIAQCVSALIDTDPSVHVKRSAIMVIKMIIEGLGNENFIQILGRAALPLYKIISKTRKITDDEIVRLNCDLTIVYLNELMRDSLFPKQKLEKKITILQN